MNTETINKKIFIETYGCQMNEADTEIVRAVLAKDNFEFIQDELSADVVILNTCAIRENAHRKVYGRVHDIRHRRNGKPVTIGILGCMATNLRQELLDDESLNVDFIAGPDSYKRLGDLIRQSGLNGEKPFDVTLSEFETYSDIYPQHKSGVNAWVSVMRGCDNFCTFCVVPYTRGRERSRSVENIVEEVKRLASEGFQQVTLLGQNVNSYLDISRVIARSVQNEPTKQSYTKIASQKTLAMTDEKEIAKTNTPSASSDEKPRDFADLLQAVSQVDGIERIRFTSPHPKDFPDKLINVVTHNPKVCKNIHLPLQSGNSRVLDLMNRTYTQEEFLALAAKIRKICPDIFLSTDVIVGFPTETDAEFEDTVKVIQAVKFDAAFIFKYSQRKNTLASKKYPDDISEEVKKQRIIRLQDIQKEITYKKNSSHMGKTMTILTEKGTNKLKDDFVGRTDGGHLVLIDKGDYHAGQFLNVTIVSASPHALRGKIQH
ncbi:MAG: radical SAM protein [Candidatus Omnitrophica bacterium]|nr:radical SAM protein [Candidatus Omnitrophota bacterium]